MALLAAINAKYIHTNLAVRYLREACHVPMREYSINDRAEQIAADLFRSGEKLILFSCYLWNIRMVLSLCDLLKKADPAIKTLLGGPEVSFSAEKLLLDEPSVDFVLRGEGEAALPVFLAGFEAGDFSAVPNLSYRQNGAIMENPDMEEIPLEQLPFPYREGELRALGGRLIYYETSRGCPFRCAFCLSSATQGVRFLPMERVRQELMVFITERVPLVKLVDRTFNADNRRAVEIVEFIKKHSVCTRFHFEVKAETMSEELLRALETVDRDLFQLEIGVQSTHVPTLEKIKRGADFAKIAAVTKRLRKNPYLHLHLDLIAGLPKETMEAFRRSFDDVFALRPQDLQLGFLKKLNGAKIDTEGSVFSAEPPYEVIRSDAMSYAELLDLKDVEDVLEKYYNSGSFSHTLDYLLEGEGSAFDFFASLAEYFREKGKNGQSLAKRELYEILKRYCDEKLQKPQAEQYLIYDYCLRYRDDLSFMKPCDLKSRAFAFLRQPALVEKYFPHDAAEKPTALYKKLRFYVLGDRILAFDTKKEQAFDLTEDFYEK